MRLWTESFRTIGRRTVERAIADVLIGYEGTRRYCPVAFAEEGDANVLGATAMEIIGLEVDPSTREVRRISAHAARELLRRPRRIRDRASGHDLNNPVNHTLQLGKKFPFSSLHGKCC